ncbi:MAG: phosphoglycerate kinase [Gammaproteobacteria bacterium]
MRSLKDIDIAGKRVIVREDFNVPMQDGRITDDTRLKAGIPTLEYIVKHGGAAIVLSHFGRPKEGEFEDQYSLQPIANALSHLLSRPVRFESNWLEGFDIESGEIVLCENVRFQPGEKANDDGLSKRMAKLGDVFVNDAFATAHRAQASTHGIAKFADIACAGPLLKAEIDALSQALSAPKRPLVAIVGGSKVSTKLDVLESLSQKVDQLIVGGGIANTFLLADNKSVGKSLCEPDMIAIAKRLIDSSAASGATIPIPKDVVCGQAFDAATPAETKPADKIAEDDMVMDLGPQSLEEIELILKSAGTIVWNGPLGVFEFPQFSMGTERLARAIANSSAFSIAGGGDTLAAISKFNVSEKISYISTGGGAFLEFLEGKALPAVEILESRAANTGA